MLNFIVVIPVFNEAHILPKLVERLKECKIFERTLFVDDGSTDNTPSLLEGLGAFFLRNPKNTGKGYAQRIGFRWALSQDFDYIVTMDGDLQHDPCWIWNMLKKMNEGGYDMVIGSRWSELSKMPKDRYLSNRLTTLAISLLTRRKIRDSQSGLRVYRKELLKEIDFKYNRFEAESEILIKALLSGKKVGFVEILAVYHPELKSKIKRALDTLRFLRMYFELAFRLS